MSGEAHNDDLLHEEVKEHFRDEARKAKKAALPEKNLIGDVREGYFTHIHDGTEDEIHENESFGMAEYLHELGEIQRLRAKKKRNKK
jgi:hypothetical protein